MPSSFGQWLIVILALLVGAAAGWVLRGRQETPSSATPIVEGDPVAGVAVVSSPAPEATIDEPRPEATVTPASAPVAVLDRPAPDTASPTPAGGVLADADPAAFTSPDDAPTAPVGTTPAGAGTAEDASVDTTPAGSGPAGEAAPETTRADEPAATADDPEPATVPEPVAVTPAEPVAEAEAATPVVPAPRTPVDDAVSPAADGPAAQDAPVEPEPAATAAVEPTPVTAPVEPEPTPVAAAVEPEPTPVTAAVASTGSTDDFRRIQGIGPKMAAALQDAGIRTYQQLADSDEAALRETIRAAGLRAAPSLATWPQQAKVLAGAPAEADRVLPTGGTED
ncbi:helix-hairpin-helix domain-containing protein [Micromonospora sp. NPDC002575]|uniref:helix-hairpin-helix domain-containing protein n=1 Tax=Micromonospora sp. NPDC002575 TaxID=3364222 RepID=UPI0036CB37A0